MLILLINSIVWILMLILVIVLEYPNSLNHIFEHVENFGDGSLMRWSSKTGKFIYQI